MTLHDGTHISWWPKDDISKSSAIIHKDWVEAGTTSSYNEDTEWEGKAADCIIPIKQGKLEIAAIKTWWMQFKDKTKYHLVDNNCCTVIFKALKSGGARQYYPTPWDLVATPASLKEYALELQKVTQ